MASGNLKIMDSEIRSYGKEIRSYSFFIGTGILHYINIVESIQKLAIQDKEINEQLGRIIEEMRPFVNDLHEIGASVDKECRKFIADVDREDSFIY